MQTIKLMADYECFPLWWVDSELIGNIDPTKLSLSQETKKCLEIWSNKYNSTLNQDYPPESGFKTKEEEKVFEEEGISLWQKISQELQPNYKVIYFSRKLGKLLTDSLL